MRISDWSSDVCSSDLHETGIRPHMFRQVGEKSDDVMLHLPFDLVDALHLEGALFPSLFRDALRHHADLLPRLRSEARRVGKECVSTCRSRWSHIHQKKTR